MLNPAQYAAVKADILASADLNAIPNTLDGAYAIRDLYNVIATPDFIVWKTRLHEQEITSLTSSEATVWSWTDYIALTVAEQNGWSRMFNGTYTVNPSLLQVRDAFTKIFNSPGGAAQRTHLEAISKEKATRIEKVLATGTGTVIAPATRVFVGQITPQEVFNARNS